MIYIKVRKIIYKLLFCLFGLITFYTTNGQTTGLSSVPVISVVPQPSEITVNSSYFKLPATVIIFTDFYEAVAEIQLIETLLKKEYKLSTEVVLDKSIIANRTPNITVLHDSSLINAEEYIITIDKKGVEIRALQPVGVFYAIQTLRQLVFTNKLNAELPHLVIHDKPRFPFRALMLDPARNFIPLNQLERFIDAMAMYKFNRLHLHLSDDQGWRVEIKSLPQLTQIGASAKNNSNDNASERNYYTQDQIKYLVKYAKERHIEIIPEIDMPAHSVAILAAFPQLSCRQKLLKIATTPDVSKEMLCAGNQQVYDFFDIIADELTPLFPSPIFHVGGNHVSFDNWKKCSKCQQVIDAKNLKNEQELLGYFFSQITDILYQHNKQPMFWYEPNIHNYPANSTMLMWQMNAPQKQMDEICKKNYTLICSPADYTNFNRPQWRGDIPEVASMSTLSLQQVYDFEPTFNLSSQQTKCLQGIQASIWGEYIPNIERIFYMTFPRALALSEVAWSDIKNRNWLNFKNKLDVQLNFLLKCGINFRSPAELYINQ